MNDESAGLMQEKYLFGDSYKPVNKITINSWK